MGGLGGDLIALGYEEVGVGVALAAFHHRQAEEAVVGEAGLIERRSAPAAAIFHRRGPGGEHRVGDGVFGGVRRILEAAGVLQVDQGLEGLGVAGIGVELVGRPRQVVVGGGGLDAHGALVEHGHPVDGLPTRLVAERHRHGVGIDLADRLAETAELAQRLGQLKLVLGEIGLVVEDVFGDRVGGDAVEAAVVAEGIQKALRQHLGKAAGHVAEIGDVERQLVLDELGGAVAGPVEEHVRAVGTDERHLQRGLVWVARKDLVFDGDVRMGRLEALGGLGDEFLVALVVERPHLDDDVFGARRGDKNCGAQNRAGDEAHLSIEPESHDNLPNPLG